MQHLYILLTSTLDLFARGGGGGSGGGGSGGGGGDIIVLLGYVPAHFFGSFVHKKIQSPIGATIAISAGIIYGVMWWFFGSFGFLVSLGAFLGGPAGYFGWFDKAISYARRRATKQITAAASKDPAWNEQALSKYVGQTFLAFQKDWSTFNVEHMKAYMTPEYGRHMALVMQAIWLRKRRNSVDDPAIIESYPVDVTDAVNDADDSVTFYVHAKASDRLLETVDGQEKEMFVDRSEFREYWHFARGENSWLLKGIDQATANGFLMKHDIQRFAEQNGLYYSADWGWLLLPSRGQLFGAAKFGTSDINNHVVGMYNNLLFELYTYIPKPSAGDTNRSQYIIAQVALPKRYDSLVVESKESLLGSMFRRTPRGYNKITLEWPDFNKRYNVFATDAEQVTAFELLHPVYMEKLFTLPFKVSIEVVDNVVYLYTKDKKADYETMYSILQDAFKEMKL